MLLDRFKTESLFSSMVFGLKKYPFLTSRIKRPARNIWWTLIMNVILKIMKLSVHLLGVWRSHNSTRLIHSVHSSGWNILIVRWKIMNRKRCKRKFGRKKFQATVGEIALCKCFKNINRYIQIQKDSLKHVHNIKIKMSVI